MKPLVFLSILMLVVIAADTEEDMEITITFKRYVDLTTIKTFNVWYVTYKSYDISNKYQNHIRTLFFIYQNDQRNKIYIF